MSILAVIHNDFKLVILDNNRKTYARHCVERGPGCVLLEVVTKQLPEDEGACSICRPSKKRGIDAISPDADEEDPPLRDLHKNHNFCKMRNAELVWKLRATTKRLRYVNRRLNQARELLNHDRNSAFVMSDDDELVKMLQSAAAYANDNNESVRKGTIQALLQPPRDGKKGDSRDSPISEKECDEFANNILEEISNFSKRMNDQPKRVRFSPRVMRMALSLYLKGPTAYESFRKSSIQVMPSVSTIKKLKADMTPKEGTFPRCYGWFYDEFFATNIATEADRVGHIVCDEMKLRSDFYWNPATHKCVGIVVDGGPDDRIDLLNEVKKLYADSAFEAFDDDCDTTEANHGTEVNHATLDSSSVKKNGKDYSISLTVNQYRFRSANNHTHTGEFFFNNGSLSGDELLRQVKQVIFGYEIIGVRIYGIVCDGGGNNARLFKLLRSGNEPTEGESWLKEEHVSFLNPADPTRRIAMFHCTTHGLKNMRNALLNSAPKKNGGERSPRHFAIGDVKFGWNTIVKTFERDRGRGDNVPDTALRYASVYPDKWNKMDVALAKDPFRFNTLNEEVLFVAECLNCVDEMMSIKWSDAESESDKILRQIEICKSAAEMQQCQDPVILEDLCALEYCATVGLVYLDFFMNRTKKLTRENIDHTELIIKKSFEFFERWRLDQLSERDRQHSLSSRAKTWEKRFLSHVTYLNMRIGICGFFVYSRYMLEASSTTKFIPFLHSNSSIIEALFSQIRRMQRDTPLKYAAGAGAADTMLGSIHLDNGMYCAADLAESASPCKTLEKVTHRMDRIRDTTVAEWMSGRVQPTDDLLVNLCQYYSGDDAQVDYNTARNSSLLNVVKVMRSTMPCHYSDVLWSDPDFVEYAKLSVGTPVQECFQTTALFSEADNEAFDVICQQLFFEIQMGAKALGGSTRSIRSCSKPSTFKQTNAKCQF
jgi:hypothetical protein